VGLALALVCLAAAASIATASSRADTPPCGLPAGSPLWVDYVDGTVPFRLETFGHPGLVLATPGGGSVTAGLRARGAATIYFDLKLTSRVGTPDAPADPAKIVDTANAVFDAAVKATGCSTPLIAQNELNGSTLTTPWSAQNAQYRSNVLALLRQLAARGAHPYLLIASPPYGGGEAGDWWRQVAQVADIVREFFPSPKNIAASGPIVGSRTLRVQMRQAMGALQALGIPSSRLGLMLEFVSGTGGRNGLQPSSAWFEVVKLEALAARQVAGELGLPTVWSWGWATYNPLPADIDKKAAACVYLWARSQTLCDGPAAAGKDFPDSLTEGQLTLPRSVYCTLGSAPALPASTRAQLATITGDPGYAGSALLGWAATRSAATATSVQVDAAETAVIEASFHGSRSAYLAALANAHGSRFLARNVLADELRATRIASRLEVPRPSAATAAAFYQVFGAYRARLVATDTASEWLGGAKRGIAIETAAPRQVLSLPVGRATRITTAAGPISVRPLGPVLPLAAFPRAQVQTAIATALERLARDEAYSAWLEARQQKLSESAICTGDDVPAPMPVDLRAYLPFLELN
jgi:hypothetical protein